MVKFTVVLLALVLVAGTGCGVKGPPTLPKSGVVTTAAR